MHPKITLQLKKLRAYNEYLGRNQLTLKYHGIDGHMIFAAFHMKKHSHH